VRAASATMAHSSSLRRVAAAILYLLVAQFMLGMPVNLYLQIPATHPGRDATEYFGGVATGVAWAILHGPFWLRLHALLGMLLVIAALWLLVQAIQARVRRSIVVSILGLVASSPPASTGAASSTTDTTSARC
jgi:hypothetical protein